MFNRQPKQEKIIAEYVMQNKESFYRLAYSYVQNRDDALDIVQDSIQKAITAGTLKDIQAVKSWFYRIVVNTSLDFLRRRKKVTVLDDTTIQLHSPSHEDHYHDMDLEQALNSLPIQYRSVVVLRYFEDLKIEDVAEILELNINTAKTRLYKALKILRDQMNDLHLEEVRHNG
ncbi:RNA polymerase sigma factor SigV [Ornithinibacillus bavariensis]|uniref:RNA polymerase sigma factor SigV n=2 Tax=Ornithinibacillus bavariensis TaxID=545502 RepID=A0A919X8H0_9BACI|nr:RNA polymerase sigma factor SigV [Ornithinibacillus bavariensis]